MSASAARRLDGHVQRPEAVTFYINGVATACYPGETVAAALLAAGIPAFARTPSGAPRRVTCNMGVCFDCLVTIDGQPAQRSCMTRVRAGMRVEVSS